VKFLVRDPHSDIYEIGIFARQSGIYRSWRSSLSTYPFYGNISRGEYNAYISQTVKDVRGGQDTLIDVFDRVECFFRRLEIYTEVTPTTQMMETIIRIMAEVLSILGIATKEIRQGRMSE
jgi:hypothetical protein